MWRRDSGVCEVTTCNVMVHTSLSKRYFPHLLLARSHQTFHVRTILIHLMDVRFHVGQLGHIGEAKV